MTRRYVHIAEQVPSSTTSPTVATSINQAPKIGEQPVRWERMCLGESARLPRPCDHVRAPDAHRCTCLSRHFLPLGLFVTPLSSSSKLEGYASLLVRASTTFSVSPPSYVFYAFLSILV